MSDERTGCPPWERSHLRRNATGVHTATVGTCPRHTCPRQGTPAQGTPAQGSARKPTHHVGRQDGLTICCLLARSSATARALALRQRSRYGGTDGPSPPTGPPHRFLLPSAASSSFTIHAPSSQHAAFPARPTREAVPRSRIATRATRTNRIVCSTNGFF